MTDTESETETEATPEPAREPDAAPRTPRYNQTTGAFN